MKYENLCGEMIEFKEKNTYILIKTVIDTILACMALIIVAPILLLVAILIKLDSKGPIIYKQKRLGKDGKEFMIYKFRTMVSNAEEVMKNFTPEQKEEFQKFFKLENDPRITRIGNILRKTSLDELPQIFNIIKGDMAIVGPRPVVLKEIEKFGNLKYEYLSVKPGLTGWWACNGRSITTYEERIELEMYYINNLSFKLDVKCLIKTVVAILKREGAM